MKKSSRKGSSFEREICTILSQWWSSNVTDEMRSDIFWRTAGSGAWATNRRRRGLDTKNHNSDVCAIDPIGIPLTSTITFEIKRGYSACSFQDLLDGVGDVCKHQYARWIEQVHGSSVAAGTDYWAIIFKRDRKNPLIMSNSHMQEFQSFGVGALGHNYVSARLGRIFRMIDFQLDDPRLYIESLDDWLTRVRPSQIKSHHVLQSKNGGGRE